MNDKQIKIVALDLDGTTLNDQNQISPRTAATLKAAMERGVHVVICTGRTFQSLPKQLFSIAGLEYVVTSNGAKITDLAEMKTIYENHIAAAAVERIVGLLQTRDYSVEIFVDGKAYIAKEEYEEYLSMGSSYRDVDYIIRTRNPVPNFYDFFLENRSVIENINISFPVLAERESITHMLRTVQEVTLTSSFVHNIEVGGATTSKAEALRYLMKQFGLVSSELMAVGDSLNDLEMIKLAGIGVVMENASQEMKSFADYITDTNNKEGVAKAIEKFVLDK